VFFFCLFKFNVFFLLYDILCIKQNEMVVVVVVVVVEEFTDLSFKILKDVCETLE